MNEVKELFNVDLQTIVVSIIIILVSVKYIITLIEWFLQKGGVEFKKKREQTENNELLLDIAQRVSKIEEESQNTANELQKIATKTEGMLNIVNIMDKKVESATVAAREALASKINERYKGYIEMAGIPEDEVDEFVELHKAYKGVGGNHSGDAKFEYCINHLPILPVENDLFNK